MLWAFFFLENIYFNGKCVFELLMEIIWIDSFFNIDLGTVCLSILQYLLGIIDQESESFLNSNLKKMSDR